ncbi:hypothetical protein Fmac_005747 [Flemingia macrophylla]|uniref:Uncharacterized protein n=1 Tax=Flemingia macrophylla TaxID=520843 RepID=A0ABD1N9R1_9FABA
MEIYYPSLMSLIWILVELNKQATYNDLEENDALSENSDVKTTNKESSDVTHLAKEKIVSALDLKMSSFKLLPDVVFASIHK